MTDTRMFKTIAINKARGVVRVFIGFKHHSRAVAWLAQ